MPGTASTGGSESKHTPKVSRQAASDSTSPTPAPAYAPAIAALEQRHLIATGGTMRSRIARALVVAALVPAGCSAGEAAGVSPSAFSSPTTAARSWFAAVNRKDGPATLAHFEPAAARSGDWGSGPSTWPTFTSVACTDETGPGSPASDARVHCSFHESDASAVGQPSSWWDVHLRRQPDGRWLISSYGQG